MIKDVMASGKLTTKDLMLFSIYHNYGTLGGKLTGAFGVGGLILAPIFYLLGDSVTAIIFGLAALMYVVITPLDFFSKAKRQIRSNPVFKNKMTFIISTENLQSIMYTGSSHIVWSEVVKVVEVNDYFFVYVKEKHALVIPKSFFACLDDVDIFKEFILDEGLDIHIKKRYGDDVEEAADTMVESEELSDEIESVEAEPDENEMEEPELDVEARVDALLTEAVQVAGEKEVEHGN